MAARLYIFDLDGTLYRGSEPMPYAAEVVQWLRNEGAMVRFLTNNSSRHREQLLLKLLELGIRAEMAEVYSSAVGAAHYLPEQGLKSAFVVGETGLKITLEDAGIEIDPPKPDAVVVGICRQFTYKWLDQALQHLMNGARFIATNTDATYPLEKGRLAPGAGSIVASLAAASGRAPELIGKPEPYLVNMILAEAGCAPQEAVVVGDRMETDIEAGRRAGCQTYLVLTGVTKQPPENVWSGEDLRGLLES